MDTHPDAGQHPDTPRWHPRHGPPPPLAPSLPGEAEPGTEETHIRDELPPAAAAVVARAWSDARLRLDRGAAVVPGAPPPRADLPLLAVAHALRRLHRAARADGRPGDVAAACAEVAAWAEGRGAVRTGLAFAQLAARAAPGEPRHAYDVGRLARKRGSHQGAWKWLRWALHLSRRRRDRDTLIRALAGMGAAYHAGDQLFGAGRYWRLALLHARERGPRDVEEEALLALAELGLLRGDPASGLDYGRRALDALSPHDRRLDRLAREAARHLTAEYGLFAPALLLLDALLPHLAGPAERLEAHSLRARAAAGARLPGAFEESWGAVLALGPTVRGDPEAFGAGLVQLAVAAAHAGLWRRAEHALARARETVPAGTLPDASELAVVLHRRVGRKARLREEFPRLEVHGAVRREARAFGRRAAAALAARGRGEGIGA